MFRFTRSRSDAAAAVGEEIHEHDLGLGHDLVVMNRRAALRGMLGAAGVGAVGLTVGCAADPTSTSAAASSTTTAGAAASTTGTAAAAECVEAAPGETAGPYPGDGSNGPNVLVESGVHRSDITSSFGGATGTAEGVPMRLTMNLQDLTNNCAAGAGMAVYLWQCDREGRYSLYSEGVTEENYLRGVQTADDAGRVEFTSVVPGTYPGRWPHLHFEVYDTLASAVAGENARLTSQIALPAEMVNPVYAHDDGYSASITNIARLSLETDGIFSDGWDAQLPTFTGSPEAGYDVDITIGVASREDNEANMGGGMGGPGGSGGRGGMPPGDGMGPPPGDGMGAAPGDGTLPGGGVADAPA